jgi:hypothetical protein
MTKKKKPVYKERKESEHTSEVFQPNLSDLHIHLDPLKLRKYTFSPTQVARI